jgi:HSP20 family molecular chaperone IbpA
MTLVARTGRTAPRTFGDVFGFDPFRNFVGGPAGYSGIDVARTENGGYRVELPVAGSKPDDIEVTLEENVLTIIGKSERREFTRSLLLPDEIDGDNIEATVEHGLLTLTLNVHPKTQPKKIAVNFN